MTNLNSMRVGTNHFETIEAAMAYYAPELGVTEHHGCERLLEFVNQKLRSCEIAIGKPVLTPGQRCYLDRDRRYWVTN